MSNTFDYIADKSRKLNDPDSSFTQTIAGTSKKLKNGVTVPGPADVQASFMYNILSAIAGLPFKPPGVTCAWACPPPNDEERADGRKQVPFDEADRGGDSTALKVAVRRIPETGGRLSSGHAFRGCYLPRLRKHDRKNRDPSQKWRPNKCFAQEGAAAGKRLNLGS
jgi:hypothetical protein